MTCCAIDNFEGRIVSSFRDSRRRNAGSRSIWEGCRGSFLKTIFEPGLLVCLWCSLMSAQQLISVGVKGGMPLTDSFADTKYSPKVSPFFIAPTRTFNASKNYAIGPEVEFGLPLHLSLEIDGLYRPLTVTYQYDEFAASNRITENSDAWEFSAVAKYGVPFRKLKPFIEAGPSFRWIEHPRNRFLSDDGVAAGAGVDFRLLHMRFEPEIRYTYWTAAPAIAAVASLASHHNRAEFLAGLLF